MRVLDRERARGRKEGKLEVKEDDEDEVDGSGFEDECGR